MRKTSLLFILAFNFLSLTSYSIKIQAEELRQVYILIYNSGTNHEGIHVIQIPEKKTVLMFESKQSAEKFSLELKQNNFYTPTIEPIDIQEIKKFCFTSKYECLLIKKEEYISAPLDNVNNTSVKVDPASQKF